MHWLPDKPKTVFLSSPFLLAKSGYISLFLALYLFFNGGDFWIFKKVLSVYLFLPILANPVIQLVAVAGKYHACARYCFFKITSFLSCFLSFPGGHHFRHCFQSLCGAGGPGPHSFIPVESTALCRLRIVFLNQYDRQKIFFAFFSPLCRRTLELNPRLWQCLHWQSRLDLIRFGRLLVPAWSRAFCASIADDKK
jgi:hypothetical protein